MMLDVNGNIQSRIGLYTGYNGNGNSPVHFYDDNSNEWRTIRWNDALNRFQIERDDGAFAELMANGSSGDLIMDNSIDSSEIQNNTISSADIQNNTITSADIQNGSISAQDIAQDSITSEKIANDIELDSLRINTTRDGFQPGAGQLRVLNGNTTSSTANATMLLQTNGSGSGDPFISFDIAAEAGWSL